VKELELRRHAQREKDVDRLTREGRAAARSVGATMRDDFDILFLSPASRAGETAAWFFRGSRQFFLEPVLVPGLASDREDEWRAAGGAAGSSRLDAIMAQDPKLVADESARLAAQVRALFDRVPDGGAGLAVGHSPLIEAAVYGLTGAIVDPLAECEGGGIILDEAGEPRIQELRLPSAAPPNSTASG
jgi:broad specificity phosphatase PhoE